MILSIDPGSLKMGYAVFNKDNTLNIAATISSKVKDYWGRMFQIQDQLKLLLKDHNINKILIEDVFVGVNGRTAITMGKTIGFVAGLFGGYTCLFINAVSARASFFSTTKYRSFKNKKNIKKYVQRIIYLITGHKYDEDSSDAIINGFGYINKFLKNNPKE